MAASVAALAVIAAFVVRSPSTGEQLYATQIGELRRFYRLGSARKVEHIAALA